MQRRTAKRLHDVLRAARAVETFVRGRSFAEYADDLYFRSAVERQLLIIGEALNIARRTDPTLEQRIPTIHEWVAVRNRLVYVYERIGDKLVWDTVSDELSQLVSELEVVMRDAPPVDGAATNEGGMSVGGESGQARSRGR